MIPWLYAVSNFVAVDCAPKRNLSTAWSECQVVIISAALTCEAFDTKLNFETSTLEVAVASLVPFAAIAVGPRRPRLSMLLLLRDDIDRIARRDDGDAGDADMIHAYLPARSDDSRKRSEKAGKRRFLTPRASWSMVRRRTQ